MQLHKEGQFPDPMKDKKTFWVRCANALKMVSPDAVVDRKKLTQNEQAKINRVLNNTPTWQLEDRCKQCGSTDFRVPEHQERLDRAMQTLAETARAARTGEQQPHIEWPELVPVECSRCETWRKITWIGSSETLQLLCKKVDDYETHELLEKFRSLKKRRRDDSDDERHCSKRASKEPEEMCQEGGKEVAQEGGEDL